MPWASGSPYDKLKNAELKQLLIQRGLPYSGNKAKLASRMTEYDDAQSVDQLMVVHRNRHGS